MVIRKGAVLITAFYWDDTWGVVITICWSSLTRPHKWQARALKGSDNITDCPGALNWRPFKDQVQMVMLNIGMGSVFLQWNHFGEEDTSGCVALFGVSSEYLSTWGQAYMVLALTEFIVIARLPCLAIKCDNFYDGERVECSEITWQGQLMELRKSWEASLRRWHLNQDPRWGSLIKPKDKDGNTTSSMVYQTGASQTWLSIQITERSYLNVDLIQ